MRTGKSCDGFDEIAKRSKIDVVEYQAAMGPLIRNPNASVKRRVRQVVVGTVLKAAGIASWDVVFDFDGKVKNNVSSRALTLVPDASGIPLSEETSGSSTDGTLSTVSLTVTGDSHVRIKISLLCLMFNMS